MSGVFDFAPFTHVAEEIPPEEPDVVTMNGWDFTSRPSVPYKPKFKLTLGGMRWILNEQGTALDLTTDPQHNAGRLLDFYRKNRRFGTFHYTHEFYGTLLVRFAEPVQVPKAYPNSSGLIPDFDVMLVQHNPGY